MSSWEQTTIIAVFESALEYLPDVADSITSVSDNSGSKLLCFQWIAIVRTKTWTIGTDWMRVDQPKRSELENRSSDRSVPHASNCCFRY